MFKLIYAAYALAASQVVNIDGVCLDANLKIKTPVQRVIDFKLLEVFSKDGHSTVGIFIGHNPHLGEAKYKLDSEVFQDSLKHPIKVYINDIGMIGISNNPYQAKFHIFSKRKSDVIWVSKRVNFCEDGHN